jgi:predicted enzyme related to lactoylglutathione lyase
MPILATYARVYVDDLDTALPSLVALTGVQPQWRGGFADLELAGVGRFLLIAGTDQALAPYRETQATAVVSDLAALQETLAAYGAQIIDGPLHAPNGPGLTARHADGSVVEYIQWHDALRRRVLDDAPRPTPSAQVLSTSARLYLDRIEDALPLLRRLTGEEPTARFTYRDLELAKISGFLAIAGSAEALAPYRQTQATSLVRDLDRVAEILTHRGGSIVDGPNQVPTGRNLTAVQPGGARIEYVQFHAGLADRTQEPTP